MNVVEKILARASGRSSVRAGEVVVAEIDTVIFHDLSGYITSKVFTTVGLPIKNPERVVMVFDHTFSPPTERQAEALASVRRFAREHGITVFDSGSGNIHHVVMQGGFALPGTVVVGSDSHTPVHGVVGAFAAGLGNDSHAGTVLPYSQAWFRVPHTIRVDLHGEPAPGTTARDVALWLTSRIGEGGARYAALEFAGEYVDRLETWDRWLLTLIAVDVGAKCAYVNPDAETDRFVAGFARSPVEPVRNDPGTRYAEVLDFDLSGLEPQIACPPSVGNVVPVRDVAGTPIEWAELGGHAGGRYLDVAVLADTVSQHGRDEKVVVNLVPSSRTVFRDALDSGAVATTHEAGCNWYPASAGSNQAVNMGALAAGETMISTHSRNFPGRNGSPDAQMFLASAATVAASAARGVITDPRDLS